MTKDRKKASYDIRKEAAGLARSRAHPEHFNNGDEALYAGEHYPMSFSKGLEHDTKTGLVKKPEDYQAFRKAINGGYIDHFTTKVKVPDFKDGKGKKRKRRKWEAPTAGIVFDLEGPDAQAVSMKKAPRLGSEELTFEMAEVYELALVRDVPFACFAKGSNDPDLKASIKRLNKYYKNCKGKLTRPRINGNNTITLQTAFRGSSPGVKIGPYLSQFLLLGTKSDIYSTKKPTGGIKNNPTDGMIVYGAQRINQRVGTAKKEDFMIDWNKWLEVQNGFVPPQNQVFNEGGNKERFITTPRDLTTYVHFDQLYQAYLNACIILLGMKTPFDPEFGALSGQSPLNGKDRNAEGFALYGGPHILTLVTEVATRALKAVRYQKFNIHMRLRPEALAARLEALARGNIPEKDISNTSNRHFNDMQNDIAGTLNEIRNENKKQLKNKNGSVLLPMAFPEGSPMHPSYGAGHAVVAGACVTILKAFFDTNTVFVVKGNANGKNDAVFKNKNDIGAGEKPGAYTPNAAGDKLNQVQLSKHLTLEGELNKLAANISIGRNMAGVHYFSDYYDSIRMGEEVAIGMLEEQALTYPKDDFVLSVPTFDGKVKIIGNA